MATHYGVAVTAINVLALLLFSIGAPGDLAFLRCRGRGPTRTPADADARGRARMSGSGCTGAPSGLSDHPMTTAAMARLHATVSDVRRQQ